MKISNKYILLLAAIVIVACDPLKDITQEIEDNKAYSNDITYTLTEDDYDDLGLDFGNFSSEEDAKDMLPPFLSDNFPALGKGSSALITYDLYVGSAPGLNDYTRADSYEVSEADYMSVDPAVGAAGFFNNSFKSEDYIPGILANNISSSTDGDIIAVSHEYASIEYGDISGVEIYAEDFEGLADLSGFNTVSDEGAQNWVLYQSSSPYYAARMSGYSSGNQPNVDWLILPQIDLTGYSKAELKLNHVVNFLGDGVLGTDVAVKISTDYTSGDPNVATWTDLSLDVWPEGNSYDRVDSKVSLADYADQMVFIAFYYKSTVDYAPQWRLINIIVEEGEAIETINYNNFYEYSGTTWSLAGDEVYYLSSADYDAMGTPGNYNNFSSSDPADNYVPTLLTSMIPFAQDEHEIYVVYKYYSSSAGEVQTRGNLYTFLGGSWSGFASVIAKDLSFGQDGEKWVPDNTIKYTFLSADYDAVAANPDLGSADARSNLATYGNFNTFTWTNQWIVESISFVLLTNFPGSEEGQKYLVTYNTYPGGDLQTHVILEGGVYVEFVE